MAETFERPTNIVNAQDTFAHNEVGLTNPNTPAFIKLLDNGDIEFIVQDGVGIIMDSSSQTITFMAQAIRFLTTDNNGLVWNRAAFNDQATTYSESSLIPLTDNDLTQIFSGTENYITGSS